MVWGLGRKNEARLSQAVDAVRADCVPPEAEDASLGRVGGRIEAHMADAGARIEGCADVERLLPLYREGGLAAARAMLVEDHLRECVHCREELEAGPSRRGATTAWTESPQPIRPAMGQRGWMAVAASVALVAVGMSVWAWLFRSPEGPRMAVQSTSGALLGVEGSSLRQVEPGAEIAEGEAVRTARGGHAVLSLLDGSQVEVDERSQLSVSARGRDTTIHLDRGNIIVRAAKRRAGHLYVATADCRVAVTGTVFSVRHGLAGSRVSVIEGEVRVAHAGTEDVLRPGDQVATTSGLAPVAVTDDIAWSRDKEEYVALLGELDALKRSWATIEEPSLRYESRLFGLVPAETKVFVSVPNYGPAIEEAYAMLEERLAESPALQRWWEQHGFAEHEGRLGETVAAVRACSEYLGNEVVVAVAPRGSGSEDASVLVLAEVTQTGLRDFITTQLASLGADTVEKLHFVDAASLDHVAQEAQGVYVLEVDGVVAVAPEVAALRAMQARRVTGEVPFPATPLGRRVARAYGEGMGALVAAHVGDLAGSEAPLAPRFVVAERRRIGEQTHNTAEVELPEGRPGPSAWLAAAGPMGSLDFVSPSAAGAVAVLLKSPNALLDESLDAQRLASLEEKLAEIEAEVGVQLRDDVLAALGGEVALAVDGPILPTPSWKLVLEVVDADALNRSIETFVARLQEMVQEPQVRLDREQVDGRTLQSLRVEGEVGFVAHFAVVDGYLIVTPSRGLLARAIETHERGDSLARSARFTSLMPAGSDTHCSGVVYQNLGVALGPIAETLQSSGQISPDARASLAELARASAPSLVALYGAENRMRLAAVGSMPGFDTAGLALPALLGKAMRGTSAHAQP